MLFTPFRQDVEQEREGLESARLLVAQSRKDHSLADRVERELRANCYPALRTVEVTVEECFVVLHGRVPTYYMKQMAQAIALAIPGLRGLRNDLEVTSPAVAHNKS